MVMTSTTEEAQRICYKNGLSFTELIRFVWPSFIYKLTPSLSPPLSSSINFNSAFSVLENVSVPIRTVAHHYNLREFRLRFTPASEVAPPPLDVGEKVRFLTDFH